ncbi:MAG: AsmA family protein [Nitrospirae bacterium]|nr:AsmA family protein [Nitrospirota bacterium]
MSRRPRARWSRVRLLGGAAIVVVVLVSVLAVVPFFVDLNRYRDRWLPVVESAIGRRVEVEKIELTLLTGLGARIEGLVIHDEPAVGREPLLRVESVRIRVRLFPLFRGRLEVRQVALIRPQLRLVRNPAEVVNVSAEASGTVEPVAPAPGTALAALSLADLVIDEGSVIYEDRSGAGPPTRYGFDHLDALLENLAVGKTLAVDVKTRFEGGDLPLSLKGTAGPLSDTLWPEALDLQIGMGDSRLAVTGKREGGSLAVSVRSERLDLAQILAIAKRFVPTIPPDLALTGPGALALAIRPDGGRFAVDGRIELDAGRVTYGTWFLKPEHTPFSAAVTGTLSRRPGEPLRVALSAVTLRLHTVEARGTANVEVGDHVSAEGTLATGDADVGGWERLVPALTKGGVAGRANLEASWKLDPPRSPTYTAMVRLTDVRVALQKWARPVEHVTGALTLSQDRVTIPRLAMRVGESDLTVQGGLAGLASPTGALTLSSSRLDLAEMAPPLTAAAPPAAPAAGSLPSAAPVHPVAPTAETESAGASAFGLPPVLRAASIRFNLNAKRVMGPSWPELHDVSGSVLLERGALVLNEITAGVHGGTALLAGRLDPFSAAPTFDLDARVDKLDAADVLARWTSLKAFMTGRLKGRLALAGSGSTWAELAPTLAGKGEVAITDGAFRTFNIVQDVLKAADAPGLSPVAERPDTPFQRLAAAIEIRDGSLHLEDVGLSAGAYGATASGVIGFDTSVNVRARVRVPQRSAGGWAKTAIGSVLVGSDGQLSIPILLSGRLPKPEVALDRSALAGETGQRLRERAKDALREFLDQPQQNGKTPRDMLKGLLKR